MLMRVKKRHPLLGRLVTFLNFNFKASTAEDLKKARLIGLELDGRKWRSRGEKLQQEIRSDLIPLLSQTPTDDVREQEKKLKLRQQWQAKTRSTNKLEEFKLNLM